MTPLSPCRTGRPLGACGPGNKGSWQGMAPPDANLPPAPFHSLCVSLKISQRRKFLLRGGCSPPQEGLPVLPRHKNSPPAQLLHSTRCPHRARASELQSEDTRSAPSLCPHSPRTFGVMGHSPSPRERKRFASKPPFHALGGYKGAGRVREPGLTLPCSSMVSNALFSPPYNTLGKRPISYLDCIQQDKAQIPAGISSKHCSNTQHTPLPCRLITTRAEAPPNPAADGSVVMPAPNRHQKPQLHCTPWGAEAQPASEVPRHSCKGRSAKTALVLLLLSQRPSCWAVRGTNGLKSQLFLCIYSLAACTG